MFYPLQGSHMEGGDSGLIQVKTKTPVVAGPGDHFLLRTPSPVRTIGGGLIVEAVDAAAQRESPRTSYEDLQERAEAILDERRFVEYCVRTGRVAGRHRGRDCRPHEDSPRPPAGNPRRPRRSGRSSSPWPPKVTFIATRPPRPARGFWSWSASFHRQSPESPGLPLGATAPIDADRQGGSRRPCWLA